MLKNKRLARQIAALKRCSYCGYCKLEMDRDLNAASCLMQLINTADSNEIEACGQGGSVIMLKTLSQPACMKQELSPV